MTRIKQPIGYNVYEAALDRIRAIYDLYDSVVVMFSGGKDSLVSLHIVREIAAELDRLPVNVIFEDEELIPNSVIDFVAGYRGLEWLKMDWVAIPLKSSKFVLGKTFDYVQWDRSRPWVRQPPEYALTLSDLALPADSVYTQVEAPVFLGTRYPGKCAFITGIRAQESIRRYMAVMSKVNYPYLTASPTKKVDLAKPIYDWAETDIFFYLHENQIPYCPIYDQQLYAKFNLRVATPLHSENAKRFDVWRQMDPDFYDRVTAVFPEMRMQDRYWKDYGRHNRQAIQSRYADGDAALWRYIEENITDTRQRFLARKFIREALNQRTYRPNGFPHNYLLNGLIGGAFRRAPLPLPDQFAQKFEREEN